MSAKESKPISARALNVIKGIFLMLLSIVLAINVGPIARTFAFPFIYFLGIGCYIVYIYMFFGGFYRIIKGERFNFKKIYNLIAFICLLVSIMFFIGYGWGKINNYDYSAGINNYLDNGCGTPST